MFSARKTGWWGICGSIKREAKQSHIDASRESRLQRCDGVVWSDPEGEDIPAGFA
jgi:hypothetical protein